MKTKRCFVFPSPYILSADRSAPRFAWLYTAYSLSAYNNTIMRSIKRRFVAMNEKYPNHPSFICFGRAVQGQKLTLQAISRMFSVLVDPDDYDRKDRKALLKHFERLTNEPVDNRFRVRNRQGGGPK